MTRALPGSLSELIGHGGTVRVKCRRCGREGRFCAWSLSRWFKVHGVRDDWKTIRRKFVCTGFDNEGCGSRDVEVTYELEAPEPPPLPPAPCPPRRLPARHRPRPMGPGRPHRAQADGQAAAELRAG